MFVEGAMTAPELCDTSVDSTTLVCEYVFRGGYNTKLDDWQCCPFSATAVQVTTCPPP